MTEIAHPWMDHTRHAQVIALAVSHLQYATHMSKTQKKKTKIQLKTKWNLM